MTHKNSLEFTLRLFFFIGLFFANPIFSQTSNTIEPRSLGMKICSQGEFFKRDSHPILVNIQIENIGKKKFRLWRKVDFIRGAFIRGGFNLEIMKDDKIASLNENYELNVKFRRLPKRRDIKSILPNRSWKIKRDINQWSAFSTPGTYRFRVILVTENFNSLKIKAIPPVYSNWITITVKE